MGARQCLLYSFTCAAAVTRVGRHVVSTAMDICEIHGVRVVYGDTDSVFLSTTGADKECPSNCIEMSHAYFDSLGLSSIRLEHENTFTALVLVEMKMYYGYTLDSAGAVQIVEKEFEEIA